MKKILRAITQLIALAFACVLLALVLFLLGMAVGAFTMGYRLVGHLVP